MLLRISLALSVVACTAPIDPIDIPGGVPTGGVVVAVDCTSNGGLAETAVDELWLRFEDVLVFHEDKGWLTIGGERQDINLNTLIEGDPVVSGAADVYEGPYNTVRLIVADSWVVVNGAEQNLSIERILDLPGDGFDFGADFSVDVATITTVTLVWNLDTELTETAGEWSLGTTVAVDVAVTAI
jgi:hypothetical protein